MFLSTVDTATPCLYLVRMRIGEEEWELENFQRIRLQGEVEMLMHKDRCIITWPWWLDPEDVRESVLTAETMGFTMMSEVGNMVDYSIPEVDCSDWDFMMMEAE